MCHIADWKISFADALADNGSAAFFVLGSKRKALAGSEGFFYHYNKHFPVSSFPVYADLC